jgi:hypothetical protein
MVRSRGGFRFAASWRRQPTQSTRTVHDLRCLHATLPWARWSAEGGEGSGPVGVRKGLLDNEHTTSRRCERIGPPWSQASASRLASAAAACAREEARVVRASAVEASGAGVNCPRGSRRSLARSSWS